MKISGLKRYIPSWKSAALAVLSAILMILAFPGFEWAYAAWFALVPLLFAIEREKDSAASSLVTGWLFGTCFFFGTCWWLTFSPITYAGFPSPLAYFLLLCVCLIVGVFPAIFAAILSILIKRIGLSTILFVPFIWIATEFARFWMTGNNWNAIAYSQAFQGGVLVYAGLGGIYLVGFLILLVNLWLFFTVFIVINIYGYSIKTFFRGVVRKDGEVRFALVVIKDPFLARLTRLLVPGWIVLLVILIAGGHYLQKPDPPAPAQTADVIAIQPNVPMSGLTTEGWSALRKRHVELAEKASLKIHEAHAPLNRPRVVIFPESPMNFMYEEDKEFQGFVGAFAVKNKASVLFNAAEPDPANKRYFNSAVMVDPSGKKIGQYDKIYLVPFGETVPAPLQSIVPALVGSFSYGKEYDMLPFGDARGGIMICFESHFPNLSREYVREGADVLVEMTNDGYLGPTPVLRQHLANAVFRAVETNRPLVRVTNVGISAYINERGEVLEPTVGYTEDTRVWSVSISDGSKTFYVRFGDWFAWLSVLVTFGLFVFALGRRRKPSKYEDGLKPETKSSPPYEGGVAAASADGVVLSFHPEISG